MQVNGRTRGSTATKFTVTLTADAPVMQRSGGGRDAWRMQEQALCTLVKCAQQLDDAYLAFEAGKFLLEWSTAEIARRDAQRLSAEALARPSRIIDPPRRPEREEILNTLKGLYAKALGPAPVTLDAPPQPSPTGKPTDSIERS